MRRIADLDGAPIGRFDRRWVSTHRLNGWTDNESFFSAPRDERGRGLRVTVTGFSWTVSSTFNRLSARRKVSSGAHLNRAYANRGSSHWRCPCQWHVLLWSSRGAKQATGRSSRRVQPAPDADSHEQHHGVDHLLVSHTGSLRGHGEHARPFAIMLVYDDDDAPCDR